MIIVHGAITTKPETHDEIVRLSLEHVTRSRAEPGCIAHNVHVDCEDAARLVFVEHWEDMPALLAHFAVPASNSFVQAVSALAAGPPDMKIFEASETQPL